MDSHQIESYFHQHRRTLAVLMLAVSIAAISGLFMGMRQTEARAAARAATGPPPEEKPAPELTSGLPVAPTYGDIPSTAWLANRDWNFTFKNLPHLTPDRSPQTPLDADQLAAALKARAERRAFDGAPPTVPHQIDQLSVAACMSCHSTESTLLIGSKRPATISHPYLSNCTQCHVPADGLRRFTEAEAARLVVASSFLGRLPAGPGTRAYHGAPPTVPHPLWMRQNCMSCHGPEREHAIRTSHPFRQNCLQCHAPDATFDNRERLSNAPPPAPAP